MPYLNWIAANIVLITMIQQGLFSALSGIFQLVGWVVASKWCGTLSTLDLGRIVRYFTAQTDAAKLDQKMAKVEQAVGKEALLKGTLGTLFVALLLSGCAGTFEESSGKLTVGPRKAVDQAYCRELSSRARWEQGLAIAGAGLTAASGISAWPVESQDGRLGLAIASTMLAGGTALVMTLWQADAAAYIEAGCAAPKETVK